MTSNFTQKEELQKAAALCKAYHATLFVTLNAAFYPEMAYPYLEQWLREMQSIEIVHLIVSDVGVMRYITKQFPNFQITVSCENQVLNAHAVAFYQQFHPERIVFPRHIAISEIEPILQQFPEICFECFLISSRCVYDDGNCRCIHDIEPICNEAWITKFFRTDGKQITLQENRDLKLANQDMTDWIHGIEQANNHGFGGGKLLCSICSLARLSQYENFTSLKIVGRGMRFPTEVVELLQELPRMCQRQAAVAEYQKFAKEFLGCPSVCENMLYCNMRGDIT